MNAFANDEAVMPELETKIDYRQILRDWIVAHASREIRDGLRDDTPILEQRIISSLQVMELLLFVEKTAGKPVQATQLKPATFRSIETIYQAFFAELQS